ADCERPEAGSVVVMPVGPNTELDAVSGDLGPDGFAVTVEEPAPSSAARPALAGDAGEQSDMRVSDRELEAAGVQVTFDGLGIRPRLAVSTENMRSSFTAGQGISFRASTNYPAYIARAEVRVIDPEHRGSTVAVLPVAPNGTIDWTMPADGPEEMFYVLRVYDAKGRYDETIGLPLNRTEKDFDTEPKDGPVVAAGEGDDMTARRTIPIRGGAVTVTGTTGGGDAVVMGESIPVDGAGRYVVQRILPPGRHVVTVGQGGGSLSRRIDVPEREVFYVGMADLTFGKEKGGESYSLGRLAGYAKGHTARGYTITGSIDTREGELADLFSELDAKNPDRVLRRIDPDDVYATFGDDSVSFDDAPTSGKFYLKVERDRSHLMWGDFKTVQTGTELIRSDRTLYGLQGVYNSVAVMPHGESRSHVSGYAAEPDRLVQRDTLRGTGGSAYFLKRQDVLEGTETILVQFRDPVSGRVVSSRMLTAGADYEIDYFQGIVLLKRPLGSSAGGGVIVDRPLGDYDVNLVAQYEYVPTTGSVDGNALGLRAQHWVSDSLRFGASAQRETTGIADNSIAGADLLWRRSDATYLTFEYARSEGPGFGSDFSLTGGLDLDPDTGLPSVGVVGKPADAQRLEAQADLAELTGGRLQGEVSAYYDRKEEGFVSPDYDIAETQVEWGFEGTVALNAATDLTFAAEDFRTDADRRQTDAEIGLARRLNDHMTAEVALAHTDRSDPLAGAANNGQRTDLGARLTWDRDEDTSVWVFGQTTLRRSGNLPANHRLGVGGSLRFTERLRAEAEISGGSLGAAGEATLTYDNGAGNELHFGYRMDPLRSYETSSFSGSDGGTWVLGGTSRVSDNLSYRGENTYDLAGDAKALTTAYGIRYTPTDVWAHEAALEFGTTDNRLGGSHDRKAISVGTTYSGGERTESGIKLEFRRDDATNDEQDRKTWLVSGFARYQVNDDWRLLANADALVSKSDQSSFRDGRYIEANLGFAYRPAHNDRVNALFRYTYLDDQPGVDQVNVDGDIEGPAQRSHILSFDINYDLNEQWTLGGKYGLRLGEVAARGTTDFEPNSADLAILRLDYHVVHNWDVMVEGRVLNNREADIRETGLLAGVYRHFGNNMKVGVGYQWGDVSDDLRLIEGRKEGAFLNVIGKF
ncbi:MAG: hypothetical protein ACRCSU_03445, partial [Paracoccaceae bacterium]